MNSNELRKIKYALVRNRTHDPELAKQARNWGEERIFDTYGVRIPKTTVKLKPITPERRKRAIRLVDHYRYGRSLGLTHEEAKELENYKKERIKATALFNESERKTWHRNAIQGRKNKWKSFSRRNNRNMPPKLVREAKQINEEAGLDPYDKYGFAVRATMYMQGKSRFYVETYLMKPDFHDVFRIEYTKDIKVKPIL